MKAEAFRVAELPPRGLLSRLTRKVPRDVVFVELRNLLATIPLGDVHSDAVSEILAKGKLSQADVASELETIYAQAVHILLEDGSMSASDKAALDALAQAFHLTTSSTHAALQRVVGAVYEEKLRDALSDGVFSIEEKDRLTNLATALGLDESDRATIFRRAATEAVTSAYGKALADGRFTDDESAGLATFSAALDVTVDLDDGSTKMIDRARMLARIDNGDLPIVDAPIILTRGEACHFHAQGVAQSELRTVTKRINYSGPTGSVKIMKGVRWRYGSVSVERVSKDVLTQVDTGNVFITNKKLMIQGAMKNTSVALAKIVHFDAYADGIRVEKQTGKDIYLSGDGDWELAAAVLEHATRKEHT